MYLHTDALLYILLWRACVTLKVCSVYNVVTVLESVLFTLADAVVDIVPHHGDC